MSTRIGALLAIATIMLAAGCGVLDRHDGGHSGTDGSGGHKHSAGGGIPAGDSTQKISVDGRNRTFHLYRPATLDSPAALVVVLHGGWGSGTQAEKDYHWDDTANSGHFLVVYPDGVDRAWNAGGGCCGPPAASNVDDVAFVSQLVASIEKQVTVDQNRVYATGISNGGLMAYRLACDTTIFAAIGPDSATLLGPCPKPAPISVLHIHGTADQNIPYNGGPGNGLAHINGPAVPALLATWRGVDGCAAPAVTVSGAVTTSIADCPAGRTVELITIAGAGHQWPGAASNPVADRLLGLDPVSTALDATSTYWRFFASHHK